MGKFCLALGLTGFRVIGFLTESWLSDDEIHRVIGEPARIEQAWELGPSIEVVTWNIERGTAYESVLAELRALDADVLLLQEVDWGCRRTDYKNVARDLAHALDMNWLAAGEFQEIGEGRGRQAALTGQAILSRFPLSDAAAIIFENQARWKWSLNPVQPRRGGRMALAVHTAGMLVYSAHLESGRDSDLQSRQMAELLEHYAGANRHDRMPVVIGGDFNNGPIVTTGMFRFLTGAAFADALSHLETKIPTSLGQPHPIDWIFVKNAPSSAGRVVDTGEASDHFPVMTTVDAIPALALGR
jgi:endonuclease/exonuclease/phosphatase family metal-dependent hydrolase